MSARRLLASLLCAATMAGASVAQADHMSGQWWDGSWGMGAGMMGRGMIGPGMMGPGMGMMDQPDLDLSDEQRSQIDKIRAEARKKQLSLARQLRSEQRKLQALYDADKPDREAIRAQRKKVQELQLQMIQNRMTAHNDIEDVLTDEQREQLRYHWWGHGWTN